MEQFEGTDNNVKSLTLDYLLVVRLFAQPWRTMMVLIEQHQINMRAFPFVNLSLLL